ARRDLCQLAVEPGFLGGGGLLELGPLVPADPVIIGVGLAAYSLWPLAQPLADLGVADQTGGQRPMQVEQVTAVAGVQHVTGVGHGCPGLRQRLQLRFGDAPLAAVVDMQTEFQTYDGLQPGLGLTQVVQGRALVSSQGVGTAELDQEQVVLFQIVAEGVVSQSAVTQLLNEVMPDVGVPLALAGALKIIKGKSHERISLIEMEFSGRYDSRRGR